MKNICWAFRGSNAGELDCARVVAHEVAGGEWCRLTDSTHSVCPPFRRHGRRTSARPFYCNTGLLHSPLLSSFPCVNNGCARVLIIHGIGNQNVCVTDLVFQRDIERFKVSYIIYIGSRKNNGFSYVPGILTKDGLGRKNPSPKD
jgi:hypothetical protein